MRRERGSQLGHGEEIPPSSMPSLLRLLGEVVHGDDLLRVENDVLKRSHAASSLSDTGFDCDVLGDPLPDLLGGLAGPAESATPGTP
jgi:hypothetical protein